MKVTKRQLKRIIREASHGMQIPRGSQPPLDVPMRDSGPVPKDQLRKLADIYMNDMGMSPDEVLRTPEFMEQGITSLRQLAEHELKIKITKKQLRQIIREAMTDEPIRQIPGDSFPTDMLGANEPQPSGEFRDTIVMSPAGDTLLVGGQEVALQNVVKELEIQSGQPISAMQAGDINAKLLRQYGQGYVELPISWSPSTGWSF